MVKLFYRIILAYGGGIILISKKQLLIETGISYGQLYRWKREGLIPEQWFIKQSSFTGQETFFPKDKILKRVSDIQNLKDKYSLEQISKMLSPELFEQEFKIDDLYLIKQLDQKLFVDFCSCYKKNTFSYTEVVVFVCLCNFFNMFNIELNKKQQMVLNLSGITTGINITDFVVVFLKYQNEYFLISYNENNKVLLDKKFEKIFEQNLNDISTKFKIEYKNKFNFI